MSTKTEQQHAYNFHQVPLKTWLRSQPIQWQSRLRYMYQRVHHGNVDGEFLDRLYEVQDGRCAYCNLPRKLCIEHMIPICRGGQNERCNIVFSCFPCNGKKYGQTPTEFIPGFQLPEQIKSVQGDCPPPIATCGEPLHHPKTKAHDEAERIARTERVEYRTLSINGVQTLVPVRVFDGPHRSPSTYSSTHCVLRYSAYGVQVGEEGGSDLRPCSVEDHLIDAIDSKG